jgi:hypothetical protein
MTTVTRLYEETQASANQGTQAADTLVWRVSELDYREVKRKILEGEEIPDLPRQGDTHPEIPKLVARTFRVVPFASGLESRVFIDYTTSNFPGVGLLTAVPDVTGNQFVWSATFEEVEVLVPFAYLTKQKYAGEFGDELLPIWKAIWEPVTETRLVIRARWRIGTTAGDGSTIDRSDLEKIGDEQNRLHSIGGRLYQFKVGSVTPKDNANTDINGSWTYDEGTPDIPGDSTDDYLLAQDLPYVDGKPSGLIRPPYTYLRTIPAVDPSLPPSDPDSQPRVKILARAVPGDLNNLPGVPNL